MQKIHDTFIVLFACIAICATSLYAREGNPSKIELPESKTKNRIIKFYPVPGGDPIYAGGVEELTPEQIEKIPKLKIRKKSRLLPEEFNNAEEKYFPDPVVNQGAYGSCAQAASVGHHFTYIINLAGNQEERYPHNYTWNFLNAGDANGGSNFLDGWDIINENGIPSQASWGSGIIEFTKWMTGYDKYYEAMKNRYVEYHKVNVSTPEGIETLKQWIYDFGEGASTGGLGSFSVMCVQPLFDNILPKLPEDSKKPGWPCVAGWGAKGGHVMTVVGWHDSIFFDVNNDGKITNDSDITNDDTVDVRDWERGGWLVANSWGPSWPNTPNMRTNGYYYMLYRTGALARGDAYADTNNQGDGIIDSMHNGGLTTNKHIFTLRLREVDDNINRQMTYKISMSHDKRDQISISSGVSNNTSDDTPEFSRRFIIFNYQGGSFPMQGQNSGNDIIIGLDVKELLSYVEEKEAKYFLMVDSKGGSGSVASFSLMDYRGADPVEKTCDQTNVSIGQGTTVLSIVYESDMDPLVIATDTLPTAENGKPYSHKLKAEGGSEPYAWELMENVYYEVDNNNTFPSITDEVSPDDTDDGLAEQDLGFEFPFYGEKHNKIYIATDGHILFSPEFSYVRSKENLIATKVIAVLGSDLVYQSGDKIYFKGESDKATIRWQTKHMWSAEGILDVNLDFAAIIYSSGKIEYFYGSDLSGDVTSMAVGASGGEGAHVVYDYGTLSDIPNNHKFTLIPEKEIIGMAMTSGGDFSGTPGNDDGDYRITLSVQDALEIKKVKSYVFTIGIITGVSPSNMDRILTTLTITNRSYSAIIFSFVTNKFANAKLEAFALNGRKVQTIFKGKLKAGKHTLVWDLDNKKNRMLSNGIYICKLSVDNENIVKKVAIFK